MIDFDLLEKKAMDIIDSIPASKMLSMMLENELLYLLSSEQREEFESCKTVIQYKPDFEVDTFIGTTCCFDNCLDVA